MKKAMSKLAIAADVITILVGMRSSLSGKKTTTVWKMLQTIIKPVIHDKIMILKMKIHLVNFPMNLHFSSGVFTIVLQ